MSDFLWFCAQVAIGGALVLVVLLVMVDDLAATRRGRALAGATGRPRGRRWRWPVTAGLIVILVAGGFAWFEQGGYTDPLHSAGPASGGGALYLGTEPATFGGQDNVDFAAVAGGTIQYTFALRNDSDAVVTITGIGDPVNGGEPWTNGLWDRGGLAPANLSVGSSFPGFDIGPRNSLAVTLALHLRYCSAWLPTPTLAPGTTPSAWAALAVQSSAGGGSLWISRVFVEFRQGPFSRTAELPLPAGLVLVERDGSGCPVEAPSPSVAPSSPGPD